MKYTVGDRVTRQITIGQPERKRGTVMDVYTSARSFNSSESFPLIGVQWDGTDYIERGYFEGGLEFEPITSGLMKNA